MSKLLVCLCKCMNDHLRMTSDTIDCIIPPMLFFVNSKKLLECLPRVYSFDKEKVCSYENLPDSC
jgi:hypothetical protein